MAGQKTYWNADKETRLREEREAEILDLMQRQLRYAYEHLPFYRRHYDRARFTPDKVTSIASFTELVPIITKQMLREDQAENPPFGSYLGGKLDDVCRVHGSSGTSGKPTLYAISRDDWNYTADVMRRSLPAEFAQATSCSLRRFSACSWEDGALSWALSAWERQPFRSAAGETERQIELMWRIKSTVLVTTPSYALHMPEVARSMGLDPSTSPLRLGIFIGEPGSSIPGTRQALENGWGIVVRDMATTSEMTPWGTNAECEFGRGVHVMQDEVWTEVVAKDNANRALPDGESGALVYTHLRRRSQPMIRFYSGDESHMTHEPCNCGRTYPRLPMGVYGRLDDMLLIRGANVYPSQVQRSLLSVPGTGVEVKIVLERKGALDSAMVRVERDPAANSDDLTEFDRELKRIPIILKHSLHA
jgi:phenylacetate-CoA ligase